jgi:hypothetical protein
MAARTGEHREVTIESIGARGDGVAQLGAVRLFVPLTVPGDRLHVRIIGRRGDDLVGTPVEWIAPAARAQPPCPHFGDCGGCQLQHLPPVQYRAWKREQVQIALARQGLDGIRIEPLVDGHAGARRRVRFAFERRGSALSLGFRERSGRRIVDVDVCPVATPGLVALVPAVRTLLAQLDLARRGGEVQITASVSGIDLEIVGAPLSLADREALAAFAQGHDLARVSWCSDDIIESEPIVQRRAPTALFGQVPVELPPGAFLQATEAAEAASGTPSGVRSARPGALLICSPAVARSACRSPRPDVPRTPSSATRPCSRRSKRPRAAPGWLAALRPSAAICSAHRSRAPNSSASMRWWSIRPVEAPGRRLKRSRHRRWLGSQWSPAIRRPSRAMPGF